MSPRARATVLVTATAVVALAWTACTGRGAPVPPDPLSRYLEMRTDTTGFSGAVLVARGEQILVRRAFGLADHEYRIALTPEHIFRIGSVTKSITAMAALTLVEAGRLSLDTPICDLLARCPEAWRAVTLRHLLSHTSGIPDLFGELPDAPVETTRAEIDALIGRLLENPASATLTSEPGQEYAYRNFNYMLVGYAIEVAAGELWEAYLARVFFEPLSMTGSAYDDIWEIVPGRATGYAMGDDDLVNTEYSDHSAYAAGGLRSTVDDLDRWLTALAGGRLVSAELLAEATSPYRANYGYGWQVLELFGRRMYNHTGGVEGFSAHVAVYPDEDLRLSVLSNLAFEDTKATACDLAALVFGIEQAPTGDAEWLAQARDQRCRSAG